MKVFVTGATGFIGSRVAAKLAERGDQVVALARSPEKAAELESLGYTTVLGDVGSVDAIREACRGCDAVIHGAAIYEVGVPKSRHPAMYEANVHGTEVVLDAATDAGVKRIIYVSTVAVFGNTHGEVVDEEHQRNGAEFLSYYDETKYQAHKVARDRIASGSPVVIVQPGGVYGPGDHSELGNMIDQASSGKLKLKMFPEAGFTFVHVDDVADGILQALDRGELGQSYILGGEVSTLGALVDQVCAACGRKPPSRALPSALMKLAVPVGPVVGKVMGFPPNLAELIRSSDGVTIWASSEKAKSQLGYAPRDLATGLRQTLSAG